MAGSDERAFLALTGGDLLCLDTGEERIAWTFRTEQALPVAPGLGERGVFLCDGENNLLSVGFDGVLVFRRALGEIITSPPAEYRGRIYLATGDGTLRALDAARGGETLWSFSAPAAVRSAPAFADDRIYFGDESGAFHCLDLEGKTVWTFKARGGIQVSPAVSERRVFFGTGEHLFYCLDKERGRKKWAFELDGGPVRPPLVAGGRVVFAASNSVVYCLSRRRGEIFWWEPLPSRILYDPIISGEVVLASSASSEVKALELKSGRKAGGIDLAGEAVSAGALWIPPRLVVVVRSSDRSADRILFLKPESSDRRGNVQSSDVGTLNLGPERRRMPLTRKEARR